MDRKELEKATEWAKRQSKEVKIDLPEREPGEPPPTQTQIRYVKSMSKDIDEEEIRKLGTKRSPHSLSSSSSNRKCLRMSS